MSNTRMTFAEAEARWPRLVRACQWAAILSSGEAACGLRDYVHAREALREEAEEARAFGKYWMRWGGGEAVAHFGGPRAMLQSALRLPWQVRRYEVYRCVA